jgi:putative effector of murein hydrolase LrgA (UPF0299 family)
LKSCEKAVFVIEIPRGIAGLGLSLSFSLNSNFLKLPKVSKYLSSQFSSLDMLFIATTTTLRRQTTNIMSYSERQFETGEIAYTCVRSYAHIYLFKAHIYLSFYVYFNIMYLLFHS